MDCLIFISDAVILGVICCTIGVILFTEVNQGIISGYGFFSEFGGHFVVLPFVLAAGFFTKNLRKYSSPHMYKEQAAGNERDREKRQNDKGNG